MSQGDLWAAWEWGGESLARARMLCRRSERLDIVERFTLVAKMMTINIGKELCMNAVCVREWLK
jgi:hypothetical protein